MNTNATTIRAGSPMHKVLHTLATATSLCATKLHQAADPGQERTLPEFRAEVLAQLQEWHYLAYAPKTAHWRLTGDGSLALADIKCPPPAPAPPPATEAQAREFSPYTPSAESLMRSPRRATTSHTEARPPVLRPGAQQFRTYPSRQGARLVYPNGLVTDLAGNPVVPTPQGATS